MTNLSGIESGLLMTALGVFAGASCVGWRVVVGRRRGRGLTTMLAIGTVALSALLASIGIRSGTLPLSQRFEVLIVSAWVLAVATWIVHRRPQPPVLGAVSAPALAMLVLFALLMSPSTAAPRHPTLGKLAHIVPALIGLSAFSFAAVVGVLYLRQIRLVKKHPTEAMSRNLPPLETLDRINYTAAALGFPFLCLSVVAGWLFANSLGARWWMDPTVLVTLAGLVVYAALFGARTFLGWRGRRIAWLTVVGFVVVVVGIVVARLCTSTSPDILHTT